ncbi:MAG: MarR family transcriptional regulator [Patescibacteria group bacterium]|jgi:DNA-binding MarR family transcriptional regulator
MKNKRQELLKGLIEELRRAIHSIHKEQCFSFGGSILGKPQVMILFFIYENKGVASVKEIANFLHVTPGAVTQFTNGLVGKKLVKREENSSDRRGVNIKLTANAEKDFNNFKKQYIKSASKSFSGLNDKEIEQFTKLVEKIK